ncbi:MAG: DUF2752 domain-containing protein [Ignavibacteria bacterium]|nr:DUF2752 domain-containing protein [Bacteroidota bacterium]MBL7129377.1 DUF2752 domain-containing protein [Ignavibacteria bacterium]
MSFNNNELRIFIRDLKKSLLISWIIITSIIFVLLISPFLFQEDVLLSISPSCESKTILGQECFLCGMTKSFISISQGNFYHAYRLNNFGIYLYLMFCLNVLSLLLFSIIKLFMKITKFKFHLI